ncbi:ankyrin repeat-containing domain protein, partial [Dactylonectria estremocensis]
EECKKALFLTDPRDDRGAIATAKSPLVPEACSWILDHANAKVLFGKKTDTQLLWITGASGMGKTMMSLFILRELESNPMRLQDTTVLYYFVESQDAKRNTSVSILRGLIFLLLQSRPHLMSHILSDFEYQREALFSEDSLEALWRIFQSMLKDSSTGKVFCLIDGLDECREQSLRPFLRKIAECVNPTLLNPAGSLKIVLVSRETPDFLSEHLSRFPRHADLNADRKTKPLQPLAIYIETKVAALVQERCFDEPLASCLSEVFHRSGDGSFLWVDLAIAHLESHTSEQAADVARRLRPTVEHMYCTFLQKIPGNMIERAVAVLQWVVMACRPLEVSELSAALTHTGFEDCRSEAETSRIVMACGPLLSTSQERVVQIIHVSVKDFLTATSGPLWSYAGLFQFHISVDKVNGHLAAHCLSYLEQGCLKKGPVSKLEDEEKFKQRLLKFPLFAYAVEFWPEHFRSTASCPINLFSPFFKKGSSIRKNWWLSYYPDTTRRAAWTAPRDFNLLHMAAFLNISSLAQQIEQQLGLETRLNARDSHGRTPLEHATVVGCIDMFVFLKDRGARQPLICGENLLILACRKGHVQITKYLLDNGNDVNYTPLHSACLFGHFSVAELLLSQGANVHSATAQGWTALHTAAWTGHEDCARLLIMHGAKILDVTNDGWNPLHCAASQGETPLVSWFLELGVPIDSTTAMKKTSLHRAAQKGKVATMSVLIAAGAALDVQSCLGETPLHLAARKAKPEAVEMLLAAGSN